MAVVQNVKYIGAKPKSKVMYLGEHSLARTRQLVARGTVNGAAYSAASPQLAQHTEWTTCDEWRQNLQIS